MKLSSRRNSPDLLIIDIVVLPVRPPIQIVLRVVGPEPRPVLIVDRLPVEQIIDVVLEVEALRTAWSGCAKTTRNSIGTARRKITPKEAGKKPPETPCEATAKLT